MSKTCQLELDIFSTTSPTIATSESPKVHQQNPSPKPVAFRWPEAVAFENSNPKAKLADNMAALRLLCQLREEERKASQIEQRTLAQYNGWGGLALVFEPDARDWRGEATELKTLLSPTDYSSAQASVTSAFYTPYALCRAMYEALARLGFAGGKILEPSAGTGIFLATQPAGWDCDWTAVELDTVTGQILEQLQPQANVQICGLQDAAFTDTSYDLIVGNVPFGDYPIHDRRLGNPLIHDYFLLRSVELVRPGGIVALIVSRGTLDKSDPGIRQRLAETADLLGAIRLPDCAFAKRALTRVTTDILFLQRHATNQTTDENAGWLQTVPFKGDTGEICINEYFAAHPEMIVGRMVPEAGQFGQPACRLDNAEQLPGLLAQAIQLLPADCYRPGDKAPDANRINRDDDELAILARTKQFGYVATPDGKISRRENNALVPLTGLGQKRTERIKGLLRLRDAARFYLDVQSRKADNVEMEDARALLNQAYDRFAARHGPVNMRANQLALADDPDLPFLCALEDFEPATQQATKTVFFHQRTLDPNQEIVHADTAADALIYSLHQHGRVDLPYMASLTGKPPEILTEELAGRIFCNPETGQWETADDYLAEDVVQKLRFVRKLKRPEYAANVAALESVQPAPLGPAEIAVKLGAPWVPAQVVQQFVEDLLTR